MGQVLPFLLLAAESGGIGFVDGFRMSHSVFFYFSSPPHGSCRKEAASWDPRRGVSIPCHHARNIGDGDGDHELLTILFFIRSQASGYE